MAQLVAREPMAMQPAIARQNGRGVLQNKTAKAAASQISSLLRRRPFFADSSLTPGSAVETPQAAGLGPLAVTNLQTRSSPAAIRRWFEEQISQISPKVVANAAPSLKDVQVSPCTLMTLTLSVCHAWGNSTLTLHTAGLTALILPVLTDSFHFRERLRPSRPPVFFLPGTCEEKTAGQRIRTASEKRAHAGTMPECLAITTEKAFACPLDPTRSASLCGCERHDLIRCEWQRIGWKPFSGGFRCGSVIGHCDCPRPFAIICFTQRLTQNGWRAHLRYDQGC